MGRLTTISAPDLSSFVVEPLRFTVDGLLPTGVSLLVGRPKIGKSWFALQLATAVADGGSFLGREVTPGKVVYLALEDSYGRLQKRLAIQNGTHLSQPFDLHFAVDAPRIDAGLDEGLLEWADANGRPQLVIVDTFARIDAVRSPLQSDYNHAHATIEKLSSIAQVFNASVMVVHHERKGGAGQEGADPFDSVLGSTGLFGAADMGMILSKKRIDQNAKLLISGRDIEEADIGLVFDTERMHWLPAQHNPIERFGLTGHQQAAIDFLGSRESATLGEAALALGLTTTNANNVLTRMVNRGILVKPAVGSYALSAVTEAEILPHLGGADAGTGSPCVDAVETVDRLKQSSSHNTWQGLDDLSASGVPL